MELSSRGSVFRQLLIPLLALVFVGGLYLHHIDLFPQSDNDEAMLLMFPYRFCNFGDSKPVLPIGDEFNNYQYRKLPPILMGWVRNIYHKIVGFSPLKSRILSAAMIWSVLALFATILIRLKASGVLVALLVISVGCHPSVMQAARSIRFEQEILFLGMLALLMPVILLLGRPNFRASLVCWILSGFLAACAAGSHPWGLIFPLILVGTCLLNREFLGHSDKLTVRFRLLLIICGACIPLIIAIIPVVADLENFRAMAKAYKGFYAIMADQNSVGVGTYWPWTVFPKRMVAQLGSLDYCAFTSQVPFAFSNLFYAFFRLNILFCIWMLWRTLRPAHTPRAYVLQITNFSAIAFCGWHFFYTPTLGNYHLYTSFLVTMTVGYVIVLREFPISQKSFHANWLAKTGILFLILQTLLNFYFATKHAQYVQKLASNNEAISLDTRFEALAGLGKLLSLKEETRPVYVEFNTWIIGGENQRPLFPAFIDKRISPTDHPGGMAFKRTFLNKATKIFPGAVSIRQLPPSERISNLVALAKELSPGGIIFQQPFQGKPADFLISNNQDKRGNEIYVAEVLDNKSITWFKAGEASPMALQNGDSGIEWSNVKPGVYLMLIYSDSSDALSSLNLNIGNLSEMPSGEESIALQPDSLSGVLPNPYFLDLTPGKTLRHIRLNGVSNDRFSSATRLVRLEPISPPSL